MKLAFLEPYLDRWQALLPRERRILIAGAAILAIAVFFLAVWAPMESDLARLRTSVPNDAAKLALMRAQATQAQQLKARGPRAASRGNLLSVVEQTAGTRGVRASISRMEPEGAGGARLVLDSVSFNALLSWLHDLQGQGIRVENMTVQRQPEPGLVNVRLLLRAPAA